MRSKHPQSTMALGVISSYRKKMPIYFFEQGLRVKTKDYIRVLEKVVKPWLDREYPEGSFCFQQDSALAHKSKETQKWLKSNLTNFWPWTIWPSSSPDCNPMDYTVWSLVDRDACLTSHSNIKKLQ